MKSSRKKQCCGSGSSNQDPDTDLAFQVNPDPATYPALDPIRIQGFDDQKSGKKYS
jgi:hypothetical protein